MVRLRLVSPFVHDEQLVLLLRVLPACVQVTSPRLAFFLLSACVVHKTMGFLFLFLDQFVFAMPRPLIGMALWRQQSFWWPWPCPQR
jgi:hypothetical protein